MPAGAHKHAPASPEVPVPVARPHRGPRQAQHARPAAAAAAQQLQGTSAMHHHHGLHRRARAALHVSLHFCYHRASKITFALLDEMIIKLPT